MHGWYVDPWRLAKLLQGFFGGQFHLETSSGEVFQGQVMTAIVNLSRKKKQVVVTFEWLCFLRESVGRHERITEDRWISCPEHLGKRHRIFFDYSYFYPQRSKERIKLKASNGEVSHFLTSTNPAIIVCKDGVYTSEKTVPLTSKYTKKLDDEEPQ